MPRRRTCAALLLIAAGVLPLPLVGSHRYATRSRSNRTALPLRRKRVRLPVPPLAEPGVEKAWHAANAYLGHSYVLALSDVWTTYSNLLKVRDVAGQKKAAAAFVVTSEYFTTLEALQEVDSSFTEILHTETFGKSTWNCSHYYPKGELPEMTFRRTSFIPSLNFEALNSQACLSELKTQLGFVRWSICHIEATAREWAEEVAGVDLQRFFVDTLPGKRCEGEALDPRGLGEEFRPLPGDECVNRRERTKCARECFLLSAVCSAVAYEEKRRRCCFLTGEVVVEHGRVGQQCFEQVGPRELFLMLDAQGAAAFFRLWDFGKYAPAVTDFGGFGLTGLVLSFMTEPMLTKWLGLESAEEAEVLRCRIVAELENEPARSCGVVAKPSRLSRLAGASPISRSTIDHAFLWPKGANGKWNSLKWASDFLRKYPPTEEVKALSSMSYDLSATWLNANTLYDIVKGGPKGLQHPLVALKAAAAISGLWRFREVVSFENCRYLKKQLEPVISQLMDVPMRQASHVQARLQSS